MANLPHLIFLGAPGSGKGTQSALLVNEQGYSHVSTGNLLRDEVAKGSALGLEVKELMSSGQLVSDDIVKSLIENLDLDKKSYIFDGYPRNIAQSNVLSEVLGNRPYKAVYFEVNTESLVKRLSNRRTSPDGKHIYNLVTNPPKVEGICDVTGKELVHRKDDHESVIRDRMGVFQDTIEPILTFYRDRESLLTVDASGELSSVYNEIVSKISDET